MSEQWSQTQAFVLCFFFYLGKTVGSQVQSVEQSVVLQTLDTCQVVVGAAQVEEHAHATQSCGANQLIVI